MESSLVSKIEKARDYAHQTHRITLRSYTAEFRGENGKYSITYDAGKWACDCDYFPGRETCAHTMALEIVLDGMTT